MREESNYPLALRKGTILSGRYVLNRVLGQGGFGITYEAEDYHTKQLVAVKEYFPQSAAVRTAGGTTVSAYSEERGEDFLYGKQCFLKEAETLAALNGTEGIVRVYTYFEENGTAYFAMEFVRGKSLQQYINEHGGALAWDRVLEILTPVMDALSKIHARGIIHRDVKPENIFLAGDGAVKLIDFGAARYSMGEKSRSLDVLLTHGFAPWEQYSRHGRQGPYTDVYALAATFYYAVTGRIPPDAVDRVERDELIPFHALDTDIPARVGSAVMKALAVRPEDRFRDMDAFRRALGQNRVREEDDKETKRDRPKWLLPAAAGIAAVCIAAAAFAGLHTAGDRRSGVSKQTQAGSQEYIEQTPLPAGSDEGDILIASEKDEDKEENMVTTPAKDESKQKYTVVDGRDPGIIVNGDGSSKGK